VAAEQESRPAGISTSEFEERIARVREEMRSRGIAVGLAYGTQHVPGDVQYLTGYDPHIENAAVLVLPESVLVLGGAEGGKMFEDTGRAGEWRNLATFEIPYQDYGGLRFSRLEEILREGLDHVPCELGLLSQADVLSFEIIEVVREAVGPEVHLIDASDILREMRYRKSPAELELHRAASRIAVGGMRAMLAAVQPGARELEVAACGDHAVKRLGAYACGFDAIVCSGPRINTIIGRATNREIGAGELVMLGISPRYEGYTSALGRTIVAGGASRKQAEFLDHGIRAYELATERLQVGSPARDVDLAAREYLSSVGLGSYHTYGVGHGIGLSECLELRTATASSNYDIPAGITIMLDVGLFGHPLHHGARHEDPFILTHEGTLDKPIDLPMRVYDCS
jgi:Xaa-Pro aminopeptidase